LVEQSLLDSALGFDVGLVIGQQVVELFLFAGGDDDFTCLQAMFRCVPGVSEVRFAVFV
jgi:hypothetical protein